MRDLNDLSALLVTPAELSSLAPDCDRPAAFVDLGKMKPGSAGSIALPHYPVVGIGTPTCALAAQLDTIVGSVEQALAVARQVAANPKAAAITVELLRLLPRLSMEDGLVAESFAYAVLQGSAEHLAWRRKRQAGSAPVQPGSVELERNRDVLGILLNRPEHGNAIDRPMRDALHEAFSLALLDTSIRKVVLRATGKAFSLGAELSEFGTTTDPAVAHTIRRRTLPAIVIAQCRERLEAHVQGACIGAGLEMAAFAGRLTATTSAWFQLPELAMGLLPGAGGCVSLVSRIGRQRTALLILSGRRVSARTALDWGLIDAIVNEPATDDSGADVIC